MKFSIERNEFLKALTSVQGVVEKRNTMPILSNILIDVSDGDKFRVTATDLEVGITGLFPAKIEKKGKITLNARNLVDITKLLPNQTINFELLENSDVQITCGKSMFKLHGLPAEDFPTLPEVKKSEQFSIPADELAEMIDYTAFSVSTDETRYNLSGVYLENGEAGALRMVSSDGHRLSLIDKKPGNKDIKLSENVIIPKKGLMEIRKLCAEAEDKEVEINLAKSNCLLSFEDTKIVIRLIDGEFPDYRQVLPEENNLKRIQIDRGDFLNALKRISILSQEKTRGVRFQFEKNQLTINVNNPDLGEAEEVLEVDYANEPLEIGFNARYFMDTVNLIKTEKIDLFLSDGMSQGLIRPEGEKFFRSVIMPMKLL